MRSTDQEQVLKSFEQSKIIKLSVLKQHRCVEMRILLDPGKYIIVPATMKPEPKGRYWLSIYLDCPKTSANLYNCRNPEEKGLIIAEEEEDRDLSPSEIEELRNLFTSIRSI